MNELLVKKSDLAFSLELSEARISQLIASGILPPPKDRGRYDLPLSVRAYLRFLKSSHASLAAEKTRWTKLKADRQELENKLRGKALIEVETVKRIMFERGRQIRDAILSISDRLAGILAAETDQAKTHALLTKELHQALEALTS